MAVKPISICCHNVRGFNGSVPYLRQLTKEYDIVAISEHWLNENKLNRLSEISNDIYICARSSKFSTAENYGVARGQGGVALLWKKSLCNTSSINDITNDRICGIRLETKNGAIINIFSIYLPAQGSPEDYGASIDDLSEIIESREIGSLSIVCGDTNADLGSKGGPRGYKRISKQGKILLNFNNRYDLTAVNLQNYTKGPVNTHIGPTGKSTIDYILIPSTLLDCVISCRVCDGAALNTSDHRPVVCSLNLDTVVKNVHTGKVKRSKHWDKWQIDDRNEKYTIPVTRRLLEISRLLQICDVTPGNIDIILNLVTDTLKGAATAVPTSKFRPHLRPYWNETLSELKIDKVKKYRRWKAAGSPKGNDSILWHEHKRAKKLFSNTLRKLSRSYENDQIRNVVDSIGIDKGFFWRLLKKSRKPEGNKTFSIRTTNNKVVHDLTNVLQTWKKHFENLCKPKSDSTFDDIHYKKVCDDVIRYKNSTDSGDFLHEPITVNEVTKAVNNLHLRKACGYDGIGSEEIRYAGDVLIHVLTDIFNMIIQSEYIPENFRRGIQVPLFKGKNLCSLDCNNYRGITLLTNYNKLFEMVIWSRIKDWWFKSGIVSDRQGACRSGQSCIHSGLLLQETVSRALETNRRVFVSYYDVSKAFDTVWTDGLFWQLHKKGLRGRLWRLMYSAYTDFKCKVRIDDETSEWYTMLCGIHQGGYLSLMKYTAFINPLLEELEHSWAKSGVLPLAMQMIWLRPPFPKTKLIK